MLLAAHLYRFGHDIEAMARPLLDSVAIGWDELGTDLLDGAPPEILSALTGGEQRSSSRFPWDWRWSSTTTSTSSPSTYVGSIR
ncbi:hypothetical protein ACZ90_70970 [Streptomyces albus subsp. albus]|nr:hypothetical protein ACZ90_70970 [Streptomyces albus subsp. albus]